MTVAIKITVTPLKSFSNAGFSIQVDHGLHFRARCCKILKMSLLLEQTASYVVLSSASINLCSTYPIYDFGDKAYHKPVVQRDTKDVLRLRSLFEFAFYTVAAEFALV